MSLVIPPVSTNIDSGEVGAPRGLGAGGGGVREEASSTDIQSQVHNRSGKPTLQIYLLTARITIDGPSFLYTTHSQTYTMSG